MQGMQQPDVDFNPKSANSVDSNIGQKISQLRTAKGLTRQKLAEQIGITHQQLQKYEKGINRIAVSRLIELAVALNTPIGYFFEGITNVHDAQNIERQRLCIEVMQDFVKIKHHDQQEAVRSLLKSLVKHSNPQ